jgi:predicted P-loop ATPase/GTPase
MIWSRKAPLILFFIEECDMSRILIVGANSFDSGKTRFAIELGNHLKDSGQSVGYFKPISGHNYWYNYEHTKQCLEVGKLVSKDASRVKEALEISTNLFLMNPIHSLFVPARIERPLENIRSNLGLAGASSVLAMQRFSRPVGNGFDSTMLIADSLVEEERVIIGLDEIGKLSHNSSIFSADNFETFQEFENQHYEEHVSEAFVEIEKTADNIIIESFNDSAWPWENLTEVDHVLVVTPGQVFRYEPERFRKGTFLYHRGGWPIREVSFAKMADLLKPTHRIDIRPDTRLDCDKVRTIGIECHTRKND